MPYWHNRIKPNTIGDIGRKLGRKLGRRRGRGAGLPRKPSSDHAIERGLVDAGFGPPHQNRSPRPAN